jgi:hypothetical protein
VARRKKTRVSDVLAVLCVAAIGIGVAASDWRPILAGVGGLCLMASAWMAFRLTVDCDVKNYSKPGFCTHKVKGTLLGCGDHHWEKLAAWSRYLGTGYVARWLHLRYFPILRFQAVRERVPEMVAVTPDGASIPADRPLETSPAPGDERRQVALFYFQAISCVATVAGVAATVVEIVMSTSR